MGKKIRYKEISPELKKIARPSTDFSSRTSIGMEAVVGEFFFLSVDHLVPYHNQARKEFDEDEIKHLSESIKEYGIRQPLTVLQISNGLYEVVSGERRLRAAKIIGLQKVPCIILKEEDKADAISIIENLHRKDLHPIELGNVYKKLLLDGAFASQIDLAKKLSVPKSKISEYIKYADLPDIIQQAVLKNRINSRDKLRDLVKANEQKDIKKMESISGISKVSQSSFSVLRVFSKLGKMQFQESGIKKISKSDSEELKNYLTNLIKKL